ncbi:Ureide permease 2 [Hordeum vulgare]|nr:Ureide permease 2 [Hordeum vulgare]
MPSPCLPIFLWERNGKRKMLRKSLQHLYSYPIGLLTLNDFLIKDNRPSCCLQWRGGLVLSIGNLSTKYAWAYVGLSVTEVIYASMVVVIGIEKISVDMRDDMITVIVLFDPIEVVAKLRKVSTHVYIVSARPENEAYELTFGYLNRITDFFSEDRIIGHGGHGVVYKGTPSYA